MGRLTGKTGSFNIASSNNNISATISWAETYSIDGNDSNVEARLTIRNSSSSYKYSSYNCSFYITIDGSKTVVVDDGYVSVNQSSTYQISTKAFKTGILHNLDGKKQINITVGGYLNNCGSAGKISLSAKTETIQLTNIPRSAVISKAKDLVLGSSTGNAAVGISWTPTTANYYYKLVFTVPELDASWKYTISNPIFLSGVEPYEFTDYKPLGVTGDKALVPKITQSDSSKMVATLTTYSDADCKNQIGVPSSMSFKISVPSSYKPKFSSQKEENYTGDGEAKLFVLKDQPSKDNIISVAVNGDNKKYDYNPTTGSIIFEEAPQKDSEIIVRYFNDSESIFNKVSFEPNHDGVFTGSAASSKREMLNNTGVYVQGFSKIKVSISPGLSEGVYGSTITGYSIEADGKSTIVSTDPSKTITWVSDKLSTPGNKMISIYAIDSRGRKSAVAISKEINVMPYSTPSIKKFSASREGKNIKLSMTWSYPLVLRYKNGVYLSDEQDIVDYNDGDTLIPRFRRRLRVQKAQAVEGVEAWTVWTGVEGSGSYSNLSVDNIKVTVDTATGIITESKTYKTSKEYSEEDKWRFSFQIADHLNASTTFNDNAVYKTATVKAITVLLDFKEGGDGLGIGAMADTSNCVNVGFNVKHNKTTYQQLYGIVDSNISNYSSTPKEDGSTQSLKDLNALKEHGVYFQKAKPGTTSVISGEKSVPRYKYYNFPINDYGVLEVMYGSSGMVVQRYTTANNPIYMYVRRLKSDGKWTDWTGGDIGGLGSLSTSGAEGATEITEDGDVIIPPASDDTSGSLGVNDESTGGNPVFYEGAGEISAGDSYKDTQTSYSLSTIDMDLLPGSIVRGFDRYSATYLNGIVSIFASVVLSETVLLPNTKNGYCLGTIETYLPLSTILVVGMQTTETEELVSSTPCSVWITSSGQIKFRPSRNTVPGEKIEFNIIYNQLAPSSLHWGAL